MSSTFTVKATYRSETRKFTFPNSDYFPSYDQLYHQLYRVFPIGHDFYLSKLLFSPDSFKPGRILISKEVHSTQEYELAIGMFRGRRLRNALLRFTVYDETPHKVPAVTSSHSPQRHPSWSSGTSLGKTEPYLTPPGVPLPTINPAHIPPPPIIFPPVPSVFQAPMGVNAAPPAVWSPVFSTATDAQSDVTEKLRSVSRQSCCSAAQCKADVESLISTFKEDLDRIMSNNFGSSPTPASAASTMTPPTDSKSISIQSPSLRSSPSPSPFPPWLCMSCVKGIDGTWFFCDQCPSFIICHDCFNKSGSAGSRFKHDPSHRFRQHGSSTTVPDSPAAISKPSRPHTSSLYADVVCNACNETIYGMRHKCMDCLDYDLCSACFDRGLASKHNAFHSFAEIFELGGRVAHVSIDRQTRSKSPPARYSRSCRTPLNFTPDHNSNALVLHPAFCNFCDSRISGTRYKCLDCPDFDTCPSCFRITQEQHPKHGFVKVANPQDLLLPKRSEFIIHDAMCDGCRTMIIGPRFKCMHPECPDYDLCECCEALPNPTHPPTHPMLKMNTADTVIPTVYRVGMTDLIEPVSERSSQHSSRYDDKAESAQVKTPTFPGVTLSQLVSGSPPLRVLPSPVTTPSEVPSSSVRSDTPIGKRSLPPIPADAWQLAIDGITASKETETSSHQMPQSTTEELSTVAPEYLPSPRFATRDDSLRDFFADWKSSLQGTSHLIVPEADSTKLLPSGGTNYLQSSSPSEHSRVATPFSPITATTQVPASKQGTQQAKWGALDLSALFQSLTPQEPDVDSDLGSARAALSAALVEASISGGQVFPPGAEFVKSWRILNNGESDWPNETELVLMPGNLSAPEVSVKVGAVAKGTEVNICTTELKAPDMPGRCCWCWKLRTGRLGTYFGDDLVVDIIVANSSQCPEDEPSLASSSVIMPATLSVSTAPSDAPVDAKNGLSSPTGTSTTLLSKISADGGVSEAGSDESSLIICTSLNSDDDGDSGLWEDGRSLVSNTEEEHAGNIDYVLIYESSEEE